MFHFNAKPRLKSNKIVLIAKIILFHFRRLVWNEIVLAQLAGVQEQLRQLTAKRENNVVASVNRTEESPRARTPPRTPSPRRVRFADDRPYSPSLQTVLFSKPSHARFFLEGSFLLPTPKRQRQRLCTGARVQRATVFYWPNSDFLWGAAKRNASDGLADTGLTGAVSQMRGAQHQSFNACPAVHINCRFCFKKDILCECVAQWLELHPAPQWQFTPPVKVSRGNIHYLWTENQLVEGNYITLKLGKGTMEALADSDTAVSTISEETARILHHV